MAQDPGTWRIGWDFSYLQGLKGGHPEEHGLDSRGRLVEVSQHGHAVELDLIRLELSASRTFSETWDAQIRVPYFIKDQRTRLTFKQGTSAAHREAAERNNEIHHRTETYAGVGDPEILFGYRLTGIFRESDVLRCALGVSLPVGRTEEDPYALGDAGIRHLHLQFGTGTVDPIAELYYGLALSKYWAASLSARGKISLYENGKSYQGPAEGQLSPTLTWMPHKNVALSSNLQFFYQGNDYWKGRKNAESGQHQLTAGVGVGWKVTSQWNASAAVQIPLFSKIHGTGDSLEAGLQYNFSLGCTF